MLSAPKKPNILIFEPIRNFSDILIPQDSVWHPVLVANPNIIERKR